MNFKVPEGRDKIEVLSGPLRRISFAYNVFNYRYMVHKGAKYNYRHQPATEIRPPLLAVFKRNTHQKKRSLR
jgi:hypothetical protein